MFQTCRGFGLSTREQALPSFHATKPPDRRRSYGRTGRASQPAQSEPRHSRPKVLIIDSSSIASMLHARGFYDGDSLGWLLLPPGQQRPAVEVTIAAAIRMLREDGPADIAALLRVDRILDERGLHDRYEVLARTYLGIPVASAQQANVMADIRHSLTSSFPAALRQVPQIIAGEARI